MESKHKAIRKKEKKHEKARGGKREGKMGEGES